MAKKPNISNVASGYQATTTINNNFQNTRNAFDNTLSLDGSTPNAMQADLDMNSNDILNADRLYVKGLYLDGQQVSAGTINYNGVIKETQVATSGQTVFNLATVTYKPGINNLSVYVDGVYQNPSTYTENTTSRITFDTGLHVGAIVDFVSLSINDISGAVDATSVTYTPSGSGAITTTVANKLKQTISVKDFGAKGDGATNDTAAIQTAINYANSLLIQAAGGGISNVDYPQISGVDIYFPHGDYLITSLETYENLTLRGAGIYSTRLVSSYNGSVLINNVTSGSYDKSGINISDLSIKGDRTKTSQCLIDLLRPYWGGITNVQVYQSGGVGVRVRQGLGFELKNVVAHANVGDGIVITDGIISWATPTPNNLPSNAVMVVNCHGSFNDGAGIRLGNGEVNGTYVVGGAYEYNYYSSGNNVGYQIHITCGTNIENVFSDIWVEGPAEAHVFVDSSTSASLTKLVRLHHYGNGVSGNVDRALIVDQGTVMLHEAIGHGDSYKTISGSNAPFRLNKAGGTAAIYNWFARGSTITNNNFIEDETGAVTGLTNYAFQNNYGRSYGNTTHTGGTGQIIHSYFKEGDAHPFITFVPTVGLGFGSGSAAADAYISRTAANTIGPRTGDFINVGGAWNGSHLKMGGYNLWVDASGDLRIKLGAPTSDTDGTVVGTQT